MSVEAPIDVFPALSALPGVLHGFTQRVSGIDVKTDREIALSRLDQSHKRAREVVGLGARRFIFAEQVHGRTATIVAENSAAPVLDTDALITADPKVSIGVYVADCGPLFLVDPVRRVVAAVHSGRKGTEMGVVPATIERMVTGFGCEPSNMVAQLGPCIRPPHYEIDFAAMIVAQCRSAGIEQVHDCMICTGANLDRYYSYRMEKGRTGRMLAVIGLAD